MKIIGKNNTTVTSEDNTLVMVVSICNSFKFEQKKKKTLITLIYTGLITDSLLVQYIET